MPRGSRGAERMSWERKGWDIFSSVSWKIALFASGRGVEGSWIPQACDVTEGQSWLTFHENAA